MQVDSSFVLKLLKWCTMASKEEPGAPPGDQPPTPAGEEPPMAYTPYTSPFFGTGDAPSNREQWEALPTTPPSPVLTPAPTVPTPAPTVPTPAPSAAKVETVPTPAPTPAPMPAPKEETDALIVIIAILFDLYS